MCEQVCQRNRNRGEKNREEAKQVNGERRVMPGKTFRAGVDNHILVAEKKRNTDFRVRIEPQPFR